ncbi:unnamed protein product [Heligmosomoides polygyrus]|uniref:Cyclophil_like2 domain-containing protein n=1 Tax=Heligmosomoides polygyrus TaxID=6339 RepID=A0A183G9X3_HELPZ|nr:unnamed protein product [Heligmosomoides polygyrus]
MSVDSVTKSFDSETEMQGLSRVDFVLRSLAGEQRSEALIVVAHAITLAAAAALAYPQKENEQKQKTASDGTASPITSFDWHQSVDMLEGDVVDQVNLGLRFPPGSVIALNQVNKGPPFLYQLTPGVIPPLSYGETFTNSAIVEA